MTKVREGQILKRREEAKYQNCLSDTIQNTIGGVNLNGKDNLDDSQVKIHPSESEVSNLLQEAVQQYEECMRIADLADIADQGELSQPRYGWDNPIGLVIAG